jgi:hypothetical protein
MTVEFQGKIQVQTDVYIVLKRQLGSSFRVSHENHSADRCDSTMPVADKSLIGCFGG